MKSRAIIETIIISLVIIAVPVSVVINALVDSRNTKTINVIIEVVNVQISSETTLCGNIRSIDGYENGDILISSFIPTGSIFRRIAIWHGDNEICWHKDYANNYTFSLSGVSRKGVSFQNIYYRITIIEDVNPKVLVLTFNMLHYLHG